MTRKWFQIHLSTAVVLMFVSGIALGGWLALMKYLGRTPNSELWRWFSWLMETRFGGYALIISIFFVPIAVLFLTAMLCEFLFRRREAQRP
jgi:hypothetical protein